MCSHCANKLSDDRTRAIISTCAYACLAVIADEARASRSVRTSPRMLMLEKPACCGLFVQCMLACSQHIGLKASPIGLVVPSTSITSILGPFVETDECRNTRPPQPMKATKTGQNGHSYPQPSEYFLGWVGRNSSSANGQHRNTIWATPNQVFMLYRFSFSPILDNWVIENTPLSKRIFIRGGSVIKRRLFHQAESRDLLQITDPDISVHVQNRKVYKKL